MFLLMKANKSWQWLRSPLHPQFCRSGFLPTGQQGGGHNHTCSLFVGQAGDLGCFKCPSCAKPYISATWFQKHLSKCPQPTGAIMGRNWTELPTSHVVLISSMYWDLQQRQLQISCRVDTSLGRSTWKHRPGCLRRSWLEQICQQSCWFVA